MKTPLEFYDKYNGIAVDYDHAYNVQCVDGFKVFCEWAGIPVKATPNNWADGYWIYRDQLGFYNYFEYITDVSQLKQGDWCIWYQGSSCVKSHIAMYWKGVNTSYAQFFGENQDGHKYFCLANVKKDIAGALRWKGWSDSMNRGKMRGCDVSQWNDINTDISSYDYVIIRATWGTNTDTKAEQWKNKCESLGIPYGVYCYSYALNTTGAQEEADYILNVIKNWNVQMGVWLDMEDADNYKQKNNALNSIVCSSVCQTFCQAMQDAGYYTGIYCSQSWLGTYVKGVDKFDKWVANWGNNDGNIHVDTESIGTMLQYTSHGGLDKDISYCELEHYKSYPQTQSEPIVEEPIISDDKEPIQDVKPPENASNEGIDKDNGYLFKMKDKTYDFLKIVTAFIIPLIIREYPVFAKIWGFGYSEQVVNTLAELITIINAILYVSSVGYAKRKGE